MKKSEVIVGLKYVLRSELGNPAEYKLVEIVRIPHIYGNGRIVRKGYSLYRFRKCDGGQWRVVKNTVGVICLANAKIPHINLDGLPIL